MNCRITTAKRFLTLAVLLALAGSLALPPAASAQTAGATLTGRAVDNEGTPLPGATVTATETSTGFSRTAVSDADGNFRLPSLPVGTYVVVIELSGFAPVTVEEVRLNVATERQINVTLSPATLQEAITVTAEAPLVQTTPAIGTVVSEQQLENLPLNGRQFANLAILAPGTSLAYNSDPTKPGQLTVALNGGIGRNVNFTIDGGDNTDDTIGGALQNFNLESVEEFNIQTQQYKAEYGRSSGGVLTVVTKSGTNELAGSAWGFFRDDAYAAKPTSQAEEQPYERKQYGFAVGGPFVRDRAHWFGTYETTEDETSYTVLTPDLPEFNGKSFPTPFEDELITAKLTYSISPKQYLQVRYGYQENSQKYGADSLAAPESLGTITNEYNSILAGHSFQIGTDSLNEFLFQYSDFSNLISADSNNPSIFYPSGAIRGQNVNTPQSTNQTKYQYKDDFSFTRSLGGRTHNFKTGINYIHEPTLGGNFSTGLNGQYTLDQNGNVVDITFFGGFFGDKTPIDQYSVYFQDDILLSDRLTVNVGLRYDYWEGYDLDQRSNPIWQALSTQTRFNESYLRDFQGGRGGQLENDDDNWGPRLGFTWDTKGDGRRLLRGGYGVYYDFPYTNATILFPTAAVLSDYGLSYNHADPNGIRNPDGSFFRPGDPLPPNQLPSSDVFPPNEVASPTLATPYSRQASLGYSWQVNDWLGLNFEAVTIDYRDIPFRFRANPFVPGTGQRRFPQFANFRLWYGEGRADYDGVNVSFRARATRTLELQGFYTYSEAEGNVLAGADEFRLTNTLHQADVGGGARDVSVNPLNPLCGACIGPLNTDARHRITLSGVWQGPWGVNIAGMYRYRSGLPYTAFVAQDLNGDGFAFDLPPGGSVNSERGDSFSQLDLRVAKEFSFANDLSLEIIAEVFNLFDEDNPAVFNRFGQPTAFAGDPLQGEQQLAQFGLRLRF